MVIISWTGGFFRVALSRGNMPIHRLVRCNALQSSQIKEATEVAWMFRVESQNSGVLPEDKQKVTRFSFCYRRIYIITAFEIKYNTLSTE